MSIDHVLPHDLDDLYEPGAEQADIEREPVRRDVTLRFYRHSVSDRIGVAMRADEIIIRRNGVERQYNNPNNARYNRIAKIIRENRIPLEVDLYIFTEIIFQADKESN